MAKYIVLVMQQFDGDILGDVTAQGYAQNIKDQTQSLAQNSTVLDLGNVGSRTSYCISAELLEDGTLAPFAAWHLDEFGVVRQGTPDNPDPTGYPAWIQPTGAQDAYNIGDRVSHNGQNWESTVDANVWEPGVFGWVQI